MAIYFLSATGSDGGGDGTITNPWFTLEKAWTVVSAGDTVYMRGGIYQYTTQQDLNGKNGTSGNLIKVWGYPGETANIRGESYVFNVSTDQDLISFSGNYVHFKDIEISYFEQQPDQSNWFGFRSGDMSNCIVENINYHHNGAAFTVRGSGTGNLFLNCDFHHMQDPYSDSPYDGADGLGITYNPNTASVNTVRNCRAWWCADDGFDTWQNEGYVEFDNCWSFYNGYIPDTFTTAGNGSGFKLGSAVTSTTTVKRYVHNCLAFKNRSWGFVENDNPSNMTLVNNTAVQNGIGGGLNFWFGAWAAQPKTFRNNISYDSGTLFGDVWHTFGADYVHSNNTWDPGFTVSTSDFISIDSSVLTRQRHNNNNLPENVFLKLSNSSPLRNAGTSVGLTYSGTGPDIGYFESTGRYYFISPTGSDTLGYGSLTSSWFSLNKVWSIGPTGGDTIYLRGGTYTYTIQQYLVGNSGSSGNLLKVYSYLDESPIITRGVTFDKSGGHHKGMVFLRANYTHFRGIRFTGMYTDDNQVDAGLYLFDTNNSTFEKLECDNNVQGVFCEGSYNGLLFLNSDFHDNYSNYDGTNGGNSDGIGYSYNSNTASVNTVRGCRAWNNGDDGFDSFQCLGYVLYDNCWSWHNGFLYGGTTQAGNGCGFKLGSNFPQPTPTRGTLKRRMQNCVAWDNGHPNASGGAAGVHINEADHLAEIFNCTFFDNGITGMNFHFDNQPHIFRNVISFNNGSKDVEVSTNSISSNCSYGVAGTSDALSGWTNNVSSSDFVSITPTGVTSSRDIDGNLPIITFLNLTEGSNKIDSGTYVGLTYAGSAPDRGAFEYGLLRSFFSGDSGGTSSGTNSSPIVNAGTDQVITLPTTSATLVGTASDSDGSIAAYQWVQTGGVLSTIVSPSLYTTVVTGLTSTGIRTFTLIATDDAGATSSDSVNITTYDASIHYMTVVLKHMIGILSFSYNAPPSSLITITFSNVTNWQENPAGSWRPIATGANGSGKSTKYLPSSTDGYIESDITDNAGTINNFNIGMGFALSNSLTPDYSYDYLLYIDGANEHYKTYDPIAGYLDTGITASSGDKIRTERIGSTLYAKYYRGTWNTLYTFPNTTTSNLYIYGSSYDIGVIEYLVNPVGYGIV